MVQRHRLAIGSANDSTMIDPESHNQLRREVSSRIGADKHILDALRAEIRPLRSQVRRIQPRSASSISLVGTDGGNNSLQFDPFLVHLVRVVDSSNNEYCLNAVTPSTNVTALSRDQFDSTGAPKTPLGVMMRDLGVDTLPRLSHMIRATDDNVPKSPTWVQVYRQLVEWSILYALLRERQFGTDTLIVFDGLLRSKVFSTDLFSRYLNLLHQAIDRHRQQDRRHIYIVGLAKHSKVLERYRLAMAIEGILNTDYPAYLEVPREIEEKAYVWSEYARGDDQDFDGEINKFVGGKMFLVKFGSRSQDPIWPVDILVPQKDDAQAILGFLLNDAIEGFPVPLYPRCLQKAHENAALVDFDFAVLQDEIFSGIRDALGAQAPVLDTFRLQDADPSSQRYR